MFVTTQSHNTPHSYWDPSTPTHNSTIDDKIHINYIKRINGWILLQQNMKQKSNACEKGFIAIGKETERQRVWVLQ